MSHRVKVPKLRSEPVFVIALLLSLFAFVGCDRAAPPVNGLAGFELGKTMLAEIPKEARCYVNPETNTQRCIVLPATSIAGRRPDVQLEFNGTAPQSTVTEIILTIPGCRFGELTDWFVDKIGKAGEIAEKRAYWSRKHAFIAVFESSPARCEVTAVTPKNQERVAALRGR